MDHYNSIARKTTDVIAWYASCLRLCVGGEIMVYFCSLKIIPFFSLFVVHFHNEFLLAILAKCQALGSSPGESLKIKTF